MKSLTLLAIAATLTGTAACDDTGGSPDARSVVDATITVDALPITTSCTDGAGSTVTVDLGAGDPVQMLTSAWFNRGNPSKACFEISIVLMPADELTYPLTDAVEVWFLNEPIVGNNSVRVIVDGIELATTATVNLTEFSESTLSGTIRVVDGDTTIEGALVANRCTAIYDPCI